MRKSRQLKRDLSLVRDFIVGRSQASLATQYRIAGDEVARILNAVLRRLEARRYRENGSAGILIHGAAKKEPQSYRTKKGVVLQELRRLEDGWPHLEAVSRKSGQRTAFRMRSPFTHGVQRNGPREW